MAQKTADPIQFNEEKRKRLGDEMFSSFSHPKPFKIGRFKLEKSNVKTEKKPLEKQIGKEPKHKFNII